MGGYRDSIRFPRSYVKPGASFKGSVENTCIKVTCWTSKNTTWFKMLLGILLERYWKVFGRNIIVLNKRLLCVRPLMHLLRSLTR